MNQLLNCHQIPVLLPQTRLQQTLVLEANRANQLFDLHCRCHMKLVAMFGFPPKGVTKLGGSVSTKKRNEN